MHSWGDKDVDWQGINDAASFIGKGLKRYARISVTQWKEKFGTVRVYCSFGWHGIYTIWRPGYCWYPKWWPMRLDFWLANTWLWDQLNLRVVIPTQKRAYIWWYRKAVERWPHLYREIVSMADYGELFEGVRFASQYSPRGRRKVYKHSDFWKTIT